MEPVRTFQTVSLGTSVNKGEKMSRWGNTGRQEGSVPIMGTNKRRRQAGGGM
jgi:hypothetical protein